MENLFLSVLNMSIMGCYIILFVIIIRFLLKKAPKIFSYILWSVVFVRLICPLTIESVYSLIPFKQPIPQNITYLQIPQMNNNTQMTSQTINFALRPIDTNSINISKAWVNIDNIWIIIWLAGIMILISYTIISIIKLNKQLKNSKHIYKNIYETNFPNAPFVFGILKPKIYIPAWIKEEERIYVIKHEEIHIKRFDYLIKIVAFFIVSIHWFNPLVWLAFFLMSNDMEFSCDERVIKEIGNQIKKEYSSSLLSLTTKSRIIGGFFIAFGESNIKYRIKNVLNYKKPSFWLLSFTIIAVCIVSFGLLLNQKDISSLTVEDFANQYIDELTKSDRIIDKKITLLEKIATIKDMLPYDIEMWELEYSLRPNDISEYITKSEDKIWTTEDNIWITHDESMGKFILVFSLHNNKPQYLGGITQYLGNFSTFASKETVLREFLEKIGLLPEETFKGKHIIVKFPLSTGETCQLLLSQPVKQGANGIWCVERWITNMGIEYHAIPNTILSTNDYYKDLQTQCDNGNNIELLDPMQVALNYINNEIMQPQVTMNELVEINPATIDMFRIVPESEYIGYIESLSISSFRFNRVEWLTLDEKDAQRLNQLGVDPNDMPNGFYIHKSNDYYNIFQLNDKTQFFIVDLNYEIGNFQREVSKQEFIEYYNSRNNELGFLCRVTTQNNNVSIITEQYLP